MAHFPTTRWSLVLAARADSADAKKALAALCRAYRPPVLAYLRRMGLGPAEAEDLAQSFFLAVVEHGYFGVPERERGRFRTFVLMALKRFAANASHHDRALKRGGGTQAFQIDAEEVPGAVSDEPDRVFERAWALTMFARAYERLLEEARSAGKSALVEALRPYLVEAPDRHDYAALATELSMRPNTIAVIVHRLRERLFGLVRLELAETLTDATDTEDELGSLRKSLGSAPS